MDNPNNQLRENSADQAQEDQEEIVLRLTARYVEEVQAGRQPDISEYLSRYPQYADAIASFIAYYQIIEMPLSPSQTNTDVSEYTYNLEEAAWQQVLSSAGIKSTENHLPSVYDDKGEALTGRAIDTEAYGQTNRSLFSMAKQRRLSSSQLADHLHISEDIVALLEQRAIVTESIPLELYRRLAIMLQQPVHHMQRSFAVEHRRVAEHTGSYKIGTTSDEPEQISFREALEKSETISPEQLQFWHDVFSREGL